MGESLLPASVSGMIVEQSANIIPTVVALLVIVIPISMSCWALGLGARKAINALQRKASKAIG